MDADYVTSPTTELLPWIVGIVLVLAVLRAVPRRHSRRRNSARRKTPRTGAPRPRGRQFPRELLPGRIRRVVDGDSIEADVSGFGRLSIRLANVDAPEHDQPWGRESREALARLVRGGRPEFRLLYRDHYARVVGLVSVNDIVVNEQLVRDGHAWAYDQYLPEWLRARYNGFERTARNSGAGLWGGQAKPIPPWKWRHREYGGGWFARLVRFLRRLLGA